VKFAGEELFLTVPSRTQETTREKLYVFPGTISKKPLLSPKRSEWEGRYRGSASASIPVGLLTEPTYFEMPRDEALKCAW
jgi:hypothetical protein